MQQLTPAGEKAIQELAQRYGVSVDAVSTLLSAVSAGGGTMAQFYHSELGGGGQWMRGGMTMVGDMFNSGLQSRVSGLCSELSTLLGSTQVFFSAPVGDNSSGGNFSSNGNGFSSNTWWPAELGQPSSSGGQNNSRYAYFPSTRRLAVESAGQLAIYDTLDHQIGGVQQQQGGPWGSLSFSSQYGTFTVDSLPLVTGATPEMQTQDNSNSGSQSQQPPAEASYPSSGNGAASQSSGDVLSAIERLGQLFNQGVLSNDEFLRKKAELLSRL
jgi:hypothetical protein